MILADILSNPALVGLIVGLPATVLGVIALRRTMKVDRDAAATAAISAGATAARDVVKGLNTLIDNLQEDNQMLRKEQARLQEKIIQVENDCRGIRAELKALNQTVNGA